jgi:hypothetical protein
VEWARELPQRQPAPLPSPRPWQVGWIRCYEVTLITLESLFCASGRSIKVKVKLLRLMSHDHESDLDLEWRANLSSLVSDPP